MDLYLQYGYGMKLLCVELLQQWGEATVILSPRDISKDQIEKVARELRKHGAKLLFDPQFYIPRADHETLCEHSYWPNEFETGNFWEGSGLKKLLTDIASYNRNLGCDAAILPASYTDEVDDYWLENQASVTKLARTIFAGSEIFVTVPLSAGVVSDENQIQELLEAGRTWDVDGIYLICEHPKGEYFVSDPSWIANMLDIIASFRLRGKKVIVGYANQQTLIAACAGANAIASGTWMNVRSFPPEKFTVSLDDQVRTTTNWFYCPQALSEYKIQFLDVAFRQNVLQDMEPDAIFQTDLRRLFQGPGKPGIIGLQQRDSFAHYLTCLKVQCELANLESYDSTVDAQEKMFLRAEKLLEVLHGLGIRGQKRDFYDFIDFGRAALALNASSSGALLKREWSKLNEKD